MLRARWHIVRVVDIAPTGAAIDLRAAIYSSGTLNYRHADGKREV